MAKALSSLIAVLLALAAGSLAAQPTEDPAQATRSINPYVYMRDAAGNKVFIETQFWRNDPDYDAKALRRLSDVMSGLEKLGFKRDAEAASGWDKPENVVRCRVNMEVTAERWRDKSGTLVGCEGTGISDAELRPSDNPQHAQLVLDAFGKQFRIAKEKLGR